MSSGTTQIGNWLNDTLSANCFATVTFKQCKHHDGGVREWVNREIAANACDELMRRCVKWAKRTSPEDNHHPILWATFIEDGFGAKRVHAHIAINMPNQISFDLFCETFNTLCSRFDWIDERVDIQPLADKDDCRRVVFYCLKEGSDAFHPTASRLVPN